MTPTPANDFGLYWIAARQVFLHHNPYAPGAEPTLRMYSLTTGQPLVLFAPPWILPVLYPLAVVSREVGALLWLGAQARFLGWAISWLWDLYGKDRLKVWALVLAFLWPFTVLNLALAQIGSMILLGLAGFLRYHKSRPYVAGACLFFCALKPQLLFLLWPALVCAALFRKDWKPIVGFFTALGCASLAAIALRPSIFTDYWSMLGSYHVAFWDTPTIGTLLRHVSGFSVLQYFPAVCALTWFLWYECQQKADPSIERELPVLVLVSVLASPYAWPADAIVVMPLVFSIAARYLPSVHLRREVLVQNNTSARTANTSFR